MRMDYLADPGCENCNGRGWYLIHSLSCDCDMCQNDESRVVCECTNMPRCKSCNSTVLVTKHEGEPICHACWSMVSGVGFRRAQVLLADIANMERQGFAKSLIDGSG